MLRPVDRVPMQVLGQQGWGRAYNPAFLASSQGRLMLSPQDLILRSNGVVKAVAASRSPAAVTWAATSTHLLRLLSIAHSQTQLPHRKVPGRRLPPPERRVVGTLAGEGWPPPFKVSQLCGVMRVPELPMGSG